MDFLAFIDLFDTYDLNLTDSVSASLAGQLRLAQLDQLTDRKSVV